MSGNVAVNAELSILLADMTSGAYSPCRAALEFSSLLPSSPLFALVLSLLLPSRPSRRYFAVLLYIYISLYRQRMSYAQELRVFWSLQL